MTSPVELVREFHQKFGMPIRSTPAVDVPELHLRHHLIAEEGREALVAIRKRDTPGTAQELADLVYVAYGAALTFGIDLDAVLAEVHRANMTKIGPDGEVRRDIRGKILKPPRWKAPDVAGVMTPQKTEHTHPDIPETRS